MKAALLLGVRQPVVVEDVEPLPLRPDEVRVRVDAAGVCHSDLTKIVSDPCPVPTPAILGHEGAGTVIEAGIAVTALRPGDRVVCSFWSACGRCFHCVRDESNHCDQMVQHTLHAEKARRGDGTALFANAGLGTFAETMAVEQSQAIRVDTDLPAEQLALLGCAVTTGVGAVLWTAGVQPGATVAVFGCGGVGNAVVQGARLAGASIVIAIDPAELKRGAAERAGATHALPTGDDTVEAIRALTAGRGVDYAFDVVGTSETVREAIESTRVCGTTVLVGIDPRGVSLPGPTSFSVTSEKRIVGSLYGSANVHRDIPTLVRLVEAGRLDVGSMVSRAYGLDEITAAFDAMINDEVVRGVIT